jgi:hypothetical protein
MNNPNKYETLKTCRYCDETNPQPDHTVDFECKYYPQEIDNILLEDAPMYITNKPDGDWLWKLHYDEEGWIIVEDSAGSKSEYQFFVKLQCPIPFHILGTPEYKHLEQTHKLDWEE